MFRNCSIKLKITIQELLMITKKQKLRNFNQDCSFWAELEMVTDFGCNSAILWMITLKLRLHRLFAYFILYMQHIFTDKHATDWRLQHFGESRNYCWDQPMLCLTWKRHIRSYPKLLLGQLSPSSLMKDKLNNFGINFALQQQKKVSKNSAISAWTLKDSSYSCEDSKLEQGSTDLLL